MLRVRLYTQGDWLQKWHRNYHRTDATRVEYHCNSILPIISIKVVTALEIRTSASQRTRRVLQATAIEPCCASSRRLSVLRDGPLVPDEIRRSETACGRAGCLGLGIGPVGTETQRDTWGKSRPRTRAVLDECLSDGMPQFHAGGRGADEVPKHVTQYKNSLCAGEDFKARRNKQPRTNDKTYLVNSLTAIDPPVQDSIDYSQAGSIL